MPLRVVRRPLYRKKRAAAPRRRVYRRKPVLTRSLMNHATVSETSTLVLTTNTYQKFSDIELVQFPRASTVAEAYQSFRIKYVEMVVRPLWDTFAQSGTQQIPTLYKMIDRSGTLPTTGTLAMLQNVGCKPVRFDDKQIVIRYKPGVILATGSGLTTVNTKPLISPILSTDANAGIGGWAASRVPHHGIAMYLDAQGTQAYQVTIDVTVHFEFFKPAWNIGQ